MDFFSEYFGLVEFHSYLIEYRTFISFSSLIFGNKFDALKKILFQGTRAHEKESMWGETEGAEEGEQEPG